MKHIVIICNVAVVGALLAVAAGFGAGPAGAARVPTVAVTTSGSADWQITFDAGRAPADASCAVRIGRRSAEAPAGVRTAVVRGSAVRPGSHPVSVRCGRSVSPVVWLHAPRSQVNDVATWLSNGTAGIVGY